MTQSGHEVTVLLHQWGKGDRAAFDQLLPVVYGELRKMARRYMRREGAEHTLQTTAVVNEAYIRLVKGGDRDLENRSHFYAVAATAMRQLLVDHARAKLASKRGGDIALEPLDDRVAGVPVREGEIIALDDALKALAKLNPRQAEVVNLRYFAGLNVEETAAVLNTSTRTVDRDWDFARAFLRRELHRGGAAPGVKPQP